MCDRVPEPFNSRRELRMRRPDDWHHHLRDGPDVLRDTVRAAARAFSRAIIMPNLVPPVTTVAAAGEYRERIEAALAASGGAPGSFTPLMTLYLTDTTTVAAVEAAAASGFIKAFKLYPAGATTNSDSGGSLAFASKKRASTDSAPHAIGRKETGCGCAGIFNANAALELRRGGVYADQLPPRAFEEAGALEHLEAFCSLHGPAFYGVPANDEVVTLRRETWKMAHSLPLGNEEVVPFRAAQLINWRMDG
ncbi:hypothetical protein EMIHUDRAFT_228614 [Emiliania huxleyi CCMP1516]|uniref:Dihydroorotase n=2 Tax=Emiliania huxleyi TaxID=2903 RepID=A0A0D3KFA6_EMIH1|nr:hypothetical protein EMIHUDRAFT_228614 [Emiliania huxleyi CCMP1516]EOD34441.1 hypothetical protein EMIHUDRAFT_228614 [Emiliania huxleyi CCMP1516]|eukprot:XP_005786870.1 hypothetical protein EMIHUDRAFT_228614 [Emiliania huxleyi CCMP1516]